MLKKYFPALLLALTLTFCCLIVAVGAAEPYQIAVSPTGRFPTVEAGLAEAERLAADGTLDEKGVRLVLTGSHTATVKDSLLFGQKTIFLKNGKKLPITITGGSLSLPKGSISCANDYAFEGISFPSFSTVETKLFAGSGDISFTGVNFDPENTGAIPMSRLYGDTATAHIFDGWTEKSLALYTENGLFCSSLTMGKGADYYDPNKYLTAAVGSSTPFTATVGSTTITEKNTRPAVILDGAKLGLTIGYVGKNHVGCALIHVKSGTLDYLRAGGYGVRSEATGDLSVKVDSLTTAHMVRLFREFTIHGDVSVELNHLDLTANTADGQVLELFYQKCVVDGDLSVTLNGVKGDRYYTAFNAATDLATVTGDVTFTAENCEFSKFMRAGFGVGTICGNVTNTFKNCQIGEYLYAVDELKLLGDASSYTGDKASVGNLKNTLTDVSLTGTETSGVNYLGSASASGVITGNVENLVTGLRIVGENNTLYCGNNGGEIRGTLKNDISAKMASTLYGGGKNGVVGDLVNIIRSGEYTNYGYLGGNATQIRRQVKTYLYDANFTKFYLFCAPYVGKMLGEGGHEYCIENYVYGGSYRGFWGGSGGSSTTLVGNIYNEVHGGEFLPYSADRDNAFSGGCRNSLHKGNVKTVLRGGDFLAYVSGGSIPNSSEDLYTKDSIGNTELILAGGNVCYEVNPTSRWGTYSGDAILTVDTTLGVEPLVLDYPLTVDTIRSAGKFPLCIKSSITCKEFLQDGAPLHLYGNLTCDTFRYVSGTEKPMLYDGVLSTRNLKMNGKELGLGSMGKLAADFIDGGRLYLYQAEAWLPRVYAETPVATKISLRQSSDCYGKAEVAKGIVTGISTPLAGASLIFSDTVSIRFAFDTAFVESLGNTFTFTAKLGEETVVSATRASLTLTESGKNRFYTVISNPLSAGDLGRKITYEGKSLQSGSFTLTELAEAGIRVYDKVSWNQEIGDLLRAFANYATACHNAETGDSRPLPYDLSPNPSGFVTGKGPLYDERVPAKEKETEDNTVKLTGRTLLLDEGLRVRYHGTVSTKGQTKKLKILYNAVDITSTCHLVENADKTFSFEFSVRPSHGTDYLRITVRSDKGLCFDYVDRADALAEELMAKTDSKELGEALLAYLQAGNAYRVACPVLDNVNYPDTFSAGYGRVDISPYGSTVLQNTDRYGFEVVDPMYLTCTALWDGENLALLFTSDTRQCPETLTTKAKGLLKDELGIDTEYVFFNASHNHNSPTTTVPNDPTVKQWMDETFYPAVTMAAKYAMIDLEPCEVFAGKADAPKNTNFVRRYLLKDGRWSGIHNINNATTSNPIVAYENEADKEYRVIRFEREGKDILWANWQAHAAHAAGDPAGKFTADFINILRAEVEANMDVHFAYFNGASGNINFTAKMNDKVYASYREIAYALATTTAQANARTKPMTTGKIGVVYAPYEALYRIDDPEKVELAFECYNHEDYTNGTANQRTALCQKYGFNSFYEVSCIISRYNTTQVNKRTSRSIQLWALSFGNVGMTFAPYEMFDTDAVKVREASPFPMTFTCGYTNGTLSYMPSNEAFPHGGYEVDCTSYAYGTSGHCNDNMIAALKELWETN